MRKEKCDRRGHIPPGGKANRPLCLNVVILISVLYESVENFMHGFVFFPLGWQGNIRNVRETNF